VVLGKQSVAEAGKEFLNHAVGGEGRVNSCRIVWWSERTSSPIHISEQRGAVHQQMHTRTHTAYHIQFVKWFSGPSFAKSPVFVTVQQSGHGATRHIHTLRQVLLPSNKNIVSQPQATRYVSTVSGNRAVEQLLHKWCLHVLPNLNHLSYTEQLESINTFDNTRLYRKTYGIGCLAREPKIISFVLFWLMIILLVWDHVLRFSTYFFMWLSWSPLDKSSDKVVSSTNLWTKQSSCRSLIWSQPRTLRHTSKQLGPIRKSVVNFYTLLATF